MIRHPPISRHFMVKPALHTVFYSPANDAFAPAYLPVEYDRLRITRKPSSCLDPCLCAALPKALGFNQISHGLNRYPIAVMLVHGQSVLII